VVVGEAMGTDTFTSEEERCYIFIHTVFIPGFEHVRFVRLRQDFYREEELWSREQTVSFFSF